MMTAYDYRYYRWLQTEHLQASTKVREEKEKKVMITIDCDGSTDCELGLEFCQACAQDRQEQEIDHAIMNAEEQDIDHAEA